MAVTAAVLTYILFRSLGIEPVVMSDEQRFSTYSRILRPADASVPSYLFYALFHLTSECGSGFLECGRLINVVLLGLSSIPVYLISRKYLPANTSVFLTLAALLAPSGYYTTYYMPEILYYFLFLTSTWVIISEANYQNRLLHSCVSGFLIGLLSLVKPHAFFLVPAYIAYRIYEHNFIRRSPGGWLKLCAFIFTSLATMLLTRFVIGYWIAGQAGANLIGSMYGDVVNKNASPDLRRTLLTNLHVLAGHLYGLLVLFAMPLVSGLILLFRQEDNENKNVKGTIFFAGAILLSMLSITALYTVQVDGLNPFESINRLHMRYYFFLFPIFTSIGAIFISQSDFHLKTSQKFFVLIIFAATIFSGFFGLQGYTPYPIDAPALWAISTTPLVLHTFTILQAITLAALIYRPAFASRVFICLFIPAVIIQSALAFPNFFSNYRTPSASDQAGIFYTMTIGSRDPVIVVGDDDSAVTRTIFHLNNTDIEKRLISKTSTVTATLIPPKTRWLICLNGNSLDPALHGDLAFDMPGYKIWHVGTSAYDVDFASLDWAGVESISGISHQESFGRWSDGKNVVIRFSRDIPSNITLDLLAFAFGKNIGKPFAVTIGNQSSQFVLSEMANTTKIEFKDVAPHTREVVIEVPQPTSPKEMGLSDDTRQLGIALSHLTITPL